MEDCLLIIDVQNGFLSDSTRCILGPLEELCRSGRFGCILSTRFVNLPGSQYVRRMGWGKLQAPPETDLVGFVEEVSDRIFVKHTYTALTCELRQFLSDNRVSKVYVCGIDTDCCVLKTAADLFEADLDFQVLMDYTASNGGEESYLSAERVMERLLGKDSLLYGRI